MVLRGYSNSHGAAYKAKFEGGDVALIKEARAFDEEKESFNGAVQFMGRLHHRHHIALRGFSTGHKRLLVFDNIENGSLKEHFNGKSRKHDLCIIEMIFFRFKHLALGKSSRDSFEARLKIAAGAAPALVSYKIIFPALKDNSLQLFHLVGSASTSSLYTLRLSIPNP
ncbi:hypothetical protein PTKIN_Ptkin11bG0069000 [Pterospermum kingtungense]